MLELKYIYNNKLGLICKKKIIKRYNNNQIFFVWEYLKWKKKPEYLFKLKTKNSFCFLDYKLFLVSFQKKRKKNRGYFFLLLLRFEIRLIIKWNIKANKGKQDVLNNSEENWRSKKKFQTIFIYYCFKAEFNCNLKSVL